MYIILNAVNRLRNVSKKTHYDISESESDRIREYLTSRNLKFENLSFPKPQNARIVEIIKKLQESDSQGSANLRDIIALAEIIGIDKYKAEDMINKLKYAGDLMESSNERFKIVS